MSEQLVRKGLDGVNFKIVHAFPLRDCRKKSQGFQND